MSIKSKNLASSILPLAPMVIIGKSLSENFVNEGGSVSFGKSLRIAFILRWASFIETSTLAFEVNVIDTIERLSYDLDSIFFMFSKDAIASSTFLVTVFSISLGEAPGYTVETVITFVSNFGISS